MKNVYIQLGFGVLVALFSIVPSSSDASSFVPTGRTYYPAGNTQAITIVNTNYNSNVNTHAAAAVPAPVQYATPAAHTASTNSNVHQIAKSNLTTYTSTASKTTATCPTCTQSSSYRLVKQLDCGATVAIANAKVAKPTCSLVPSINSNGAIELQWTTNGATVAYLDNGIGHVQSISGQRTVTPSKDTAYNLTVLNDAGIAGSCGARVNVSLASAGTVDVLATNANYTYSLNSNVQSGALSAGNGAATQDTADNTSKMVNETSGTDSANTTKTTADADVQGTADVEAADKGVFAKIFGGNFKQVAIPIGIVFLILIVLLVVIMSKVKAAK